MGTCEYTQYIYVNKHFDCHAVIC